MAKKVILGTDIARDAFKTKANDNFTELYNKDVALEQSINSLDADKIEQETGTFTPSWGTATLTTHVARYAKTGKKVEIWLRLQITSKGDAGMTISGLPFIPKNNLTVGVLGEFANITYASGEIPYVRVPNTSSTINLMKMRINTTATAISNADLTDTSSISVYASYEIN